MKRGILVGLFLCALVATPAQARVPYLSAHQARVAMARYLDPDVKLSRCIRHDRVSYRCHALYHDVQVEAEDNGELTWVDTGAWKDMLRARLRSDGRVWVWSATFADVGRYRL